jgi:hypothetical protein
MVSANLFLAPQKTTVFAQVEFVTRQTSSALIALLMLLLTQTRQLVQVVNGAIPLDPTPECATKEPALTLPLPKLARSPKFARPILPVLNRHAQLTLIADQCFVMEPLQGQAALLALTSIHALETPTTAKLMELAPWQNLVPPPMNLPNAQEHSIASLLMDRPMEFVEPAMLPPPHAKMDILANPTTFANLMDAPWIVIASPRLSIVM